MRDIDLWQVGQNNLIEDLLKDYLDKKYKDCMLKVEEYFVHNTRHSNNELLRSIYVNCCIIAGNEFKLAGDYELAKRAYERILQYEGDMIFDSDIALYNVYIELGEIDEHLNTVKEAKNYSYKAKEIVNRMVASRVIESIYISFIEGKYDEVIKKMHTLDLTDLDEYNEGRYYMMMGSAYYYKGEYKMAIQFLEKAIGFYDDKPYNSVLTTIYEELSKSYSNLENYTKATDYLQKSLKNIHPLDQQIKQPEQGMDK